MIEAAVVVVVVVLRACLIGLALIVEQRRLGPLPARGPACSIVIPLYGWDERFLELLAALKRGGTKLEACEIIVVVDEDHPRRADIEAAGVTALHPELPLEPGDVDKVRRLRCGVRAARHPLVMLFDSDVVIDDDDGWLLRRVAVHVQDPALRLSFALPAYHRARAAGDAVLGSFTLHANLSMYFLGWWLTRRATSIAASQVLRNDDGVLPAFFDELRCSHADDHALGVLVGRRGERVRAVPMTVGVHASDPSMTATTAQLVRWLTAAKTIGPLMHPLSVLWMAVHSLISGAGVLCLVAAVVSWSWPWLAAGIACFVVDAASLVLLEALLLETWAGRRRGRLHHLWSLPLSVLLQPYWLLRALPKRVIVWRGRTNDLRARPAKN
ncbi:MAG: glycosyltransferase [Deltaproteobacteria bacterium]|nr:glycosyltransferase [Deltaproteobacteria bacterium]